MSTLKELFDKHGSVWLALKDRPTIPFFKPLGYSEKTKGFLIGEVNKDGSSLAVDYKNEVLDYFILYEEPKPKVKRYQYKLIPASECYFPKITVEFFKDDIDLFRYYDSQAFDKFERLDSTMQEFDW